MSCEQISGGEDAAQCFGRGWQAKVSMRKQRTINDYTTRGTAFRGSVRACSRIREPHAARLSRRKFRPGRVAARRTRTGHARDEIADQGANVDGWGMCLSVVTASRTLPSAY